jgi:CheY-like chemotaxis protein
MPENTPVLVVDDQPDNLLILEYLLGSHYSVHAVSDGSEALAYLAAGGAAELVLLDVMMPGLDGFEVCRRLKGSPATRDIPVIFLTSLESAALQAASTPRAGHCHNRGGARQAVRPGHRRGAGRYRRRCRGSR